MSTQPPGAACAIEKMEVTSRLAGANLLAVALTVAGLAVWIDPVTSASDFEQFLGRFHPLVVHFPIALIALAAGLDLASRFGRCTTEWARWIYVAGSWTGVAAVAVGLWMARAGGYDADTLFLHRLVGLVMTVGAAFIPWVQSVAWSRLESDVIPLGAVMVLAVLVAVGGHEGGTLTHGSGYLTAHAPEFLKAALPQSESRLAFGDPDSVSVYDAVVVPILSTRCTSCHQSGRTRGGLDLTTPVGIQDGGDDGPIVSGSGADNSELIRRILLPEGHSKRMPPEGMAPLSPSDATLLTWWVESGASFEVGLAEAERSGAVQTILNAYGIAEVRTGVWALKVDDPSPAAIEQLVAMGARVTHVAEDEAFVSVRCGSRAACFSDDGAALAALAQQVVWLDLARTDVADSDIEKLASLVHLERLWLQKTAITGSTLSVLSDLVYLSYLNVTETDVSLESLKAVEHVPGLYAWGSPGAD